MATSVFATGGSARRQEMWWRAADDICGTLDAPRTKASQKAMTYFYQQRAFSATWLEPVNSIMVYLHVRKIFLRAVPGMHRGSAGLHSSGDLRIDGRARRAPFIAAFRVRCTGAGSRTAAHQTMLSEEIKWACCAYGGADNIERRRR